MFEGIESFLLIGFIVVAAVLPRIVAGWNDRQRVRRYMTGLGSELLDIRWDPLGPGWIGDRDRPYKIRYRDRDGCIHAAHAKTSMLSGVYLANDEIISRPHGQAAPSPPKFWTPPDQRETIEEEKARLRKRLAELEEME